jgi:mediator of RNA polymerase II transcription subunit 18
MADINSASLDQLNNILKFSKVPNREYYLQGSVLDDSVEMLLQTLRGLCDNVEAIPETFDDHEMCFSIQKLVFIIFNPISIYPSI